MQYRLDATEEGLKTFNEVMTRQESKTWNEYMEKYSRGVNPETATKVRWVVGFFQTLGILCREKLIDPKFQYRNYQIGPIIA